MFFQRFGCIVLALCMVGSSAAQLLFAQDSTVAIAPPLAKFTPPKINEMLSKEESLIETETEKQLEDYDKSLDGIYPLLTHPNAAVRKGALKRLNYKRDEVELKIEPIAERLSDPNVDVAEEAGDLLENLGPKAAPALPALLWAIEQDDDRRRVAFDVIGNLKEAAAPAVPRLIQFLKPKADDESDLVRDQRFRSIEALGEIGPAAAAARQALIPHLEDWVTSEYAGIALGKIGEEGVLLEAMRKGGDDPSRGAIFGLGVLPKASPKVLQTLSQFIANSKDPFDRRDAYMAVGRLRPTTPAILEVLGRGLKDSDESVRLAVIQGIGQSEPALAEAIPYLLTGLSDEKEDVRQYATSALGRMKVEPEARLAALLKAGVEGNYPLRSNVEYAISNSSEEFWPLIWKEVQTGKQPPALRAFTILRLRNYWYEKEKEIAPVVNAILQDSKEPELVRAAAACILWKKDRQDSETVDFVKRGVLQEESEAVADYAISCLSGSDDSSNVPVIVQLLQRRWKAQGRLEDIYNALERLGPAAAPAVPELIKELQGLKTRSRHQIADVLGAIGPAAKDALPALMQNYQLLDEHKMKNGSAAQAVGKIAGPLEEDPTEVVNFLIGVLKEKSEQYSGNITQASLALGELGARAASAVPQLAAHLKDESSYETGFVIRALGMIGPAASETVPTLLEFVKDEKYGNRDDAIVALGKIGAKEDLVIPVIAPLLSNSDLKEETLQALQAYGPKAKTAVPALVEQLKFGSDYAKIDLFDALAAIGPAASGAFDPILELMKNSDQDDYALREHAKSALQAISPDDPRLAEAIRTELRDEDSVRDYLRLHEAETGSLLFGMLKSKRVADRKLSIELLTELCPPGTRAAIEAALDDPAPEVQQTAAVALVQFGEANKRQADLLLAAFMASDPDEPDWKLRNALQWMLDLAGSRMLALLADPQVALAKRRQTFEFLYDNSYSIESLQGELEKMLASSSAEMQQAAAILLVLLRVENPRIPALLKAALEADPGTSFIPRGRVYQAIAALADRADRPLSSKIVNDLVQEICAGDVDTAESYTYTLRRATLDEGQAERLLKLLEDDERRNLGYAALTYAGYTAPEKVVAALIKRLSQADEDEYYSLGNVLQRQKGAAVTPLLALATDAEQELDKRRFVLRILSSMEKLSLNDARKLVPLLKDENAPVREWTAVVLSKVANKADPLLPHLTAALAEEDYELRSQACYVAFATLKEKASPAVPEIVKLLGHNDESVRSTALETLRYIGPAAEAAVPALVDALTKEEQAYVRDSIVAALKGLGKPGEEKLLSALQQSTGEARVALLPAFVRIRNEAAVPEMQKSLASDDEAEKRAAAVALSCYPQAEDACVTVLVEMAQDEDEQEAEKGIIGLGRMGERAKAAVPELQTMLADRDQCYQALHALGKMKPSAEPALPEIISLLETPQYYSQAARTLGEIGSPAAVAALMNELAYPSHMWAVVQPLAMIKPSPAEQVLPKLYELLKDPHRRFAGLQAIQAFGPDAKSAIPLLLRELDTNDLAVRKHCMSALGSVGKDSPEVAAALLPLMDDVSPEIRYVAIQSIGMVGALPDKCVPALLEKLASGEESQRSVLISALGGFHAAAAPAVPVLLKEYDSNPELQSAVVATLGEIGPDAAGASVPRLVELLKQGSATERYQAIECLGKFGPAARDALPALEPLTKDANLEIRYPALRAYWKIDAARAKELGLYQPREEEEYEDDYDDY